MAVTRNRTRRCGRQLGDHESRLDDNDIFVGYDRAFIWSTGSPSLCQVTLAVRDFAVKKADWRSFTFRSAILVTNTGAAFTLTVKTQVVVSLANVQMYRPVFPTLGIDNLCSLSLLCYWSDVHKMSSSSVIHLRRHFRQCSRTRRN